MNDKVDVLNREPFIQNLEELVLELAREKQSFAFAVNGIWGAGKTYVLNELEARLSDLQCEETNDDQFYVFHYNCWQYDYYNEPAVAIVSAMLDHTDKMLVTKIEGASKDAWSYAKDIVGEIAGEFIENKIGVNPMNVVGNLKEKKEAREESERDFDKMFAFKKTLEKTRKKLDMLSQRKQIVFVVDELDRCIPSYAIKVLERMHHFFEGLDRVVVIYAVDSQQLNHSIKCIYGDNTDVDRYLRKFINMQVDLDLGDVQEKIFDKYNSYLSRFEFNSEEEKSQCFEIFKGICKKSKMDVRTQERVLEKTEIIHKLIVKDEKGNASLLMFEILISLVYSSLNPKSNWRGNLYWIPGINQSTYGGLDEDLGKDLLAYLQDLGKSIGGGSKMQAMDGNYRNFNGQEALDVAFMCMDQILSNKKVFYLHDIAPYQEMIEQCREFIRYSKFMF